MRPGEKRLGDYVKSVTNAVGIPTCQSCEQRRQKLNEWHEGLASFFTKKEKDDAPGNPDRG